MTRKAIVIGAGFSGLSAAAHLAAGGYEVSVLEKHSQPGGRARVFQQDGFLFDMGPSWYWMPDVFEDFFQFFGQKASDHYQLVRLDPSYTIVGNRDQRIQVPASLDALCQVFDQIEPGSSNKLRRFLEDAAYKYEVGIREFVRKPSVSLREFLDFRILTSLFRLQMFSSISQEIRSQFSNELLVQLLEFPVLFLGATAEKTPALYSLMNYADLVLGTWYPLGGMHEVVKAFERVAVQQGAMMHYEESVQAIRTHKGRIQTVETDRSTYRPDVVVAACDYHHVESVLLDEKDRNYSPGYWASRKMAPSCLLYYVGIQGKVQGLTHHTLFFDADFARHADEIYKTGKWPEDPLFYVCAPSVTDPSVAPPDCENLFFLIPVAPGIEGDSPELREKYFNMLLDRFELKFNTRIRDKIVCQRSYSVSDFTRDYHAFRGNAYGLANTLTQTAFMKPSIRNRKISNLFYTGQLTVPGPGMPPAVISGEVVAQYILNSKNP